MNSRISLFYFVLLYRGQIFNVSGTRALTAVSSSGSASKLYLELRNEEMPSEDPAFSDRHLRRHICRDITGSGFFESKGLRRIRMEQIFDELKNDSRYEDIFHRIFVLRSSENPDESERQTQYEYSNPFRPIELTVEGFQNGQPVVVDDVEEFVFVCVLRHVRSNHLVARYVTQEYNVLGNPYKAGRFVLENIESNVAFSRTLFQSVSLAEEPATNDENPDSNIELRYLQLRRFRDLDKNDDAAADPLCKLLDTMIYNNHHYRFCVAILRSPHFAEKFAYPKRSSIHDEQSCVETEVSFRTTEARQIATEKTYLERMTQCRAVLLNSSVEVTIHVSQAYTSQHLFVYEIDDTDGKIYLKSLCADLGILDLPRNSFEDVED